jgi:hypothetical protein
VERRITARYQLSLPVLFQWTDSEGASHKEGGFTRNVGTRGVYVTSPECPPVNATIELQVLLPVTWRQSPDCARLVATVKVLRVQKMYGQVGFACTGDLDQIRSTGNDGFEDSVEDSVAGAATKDEI